MFSHYFDDFCREKDSFRRMDKNFDHLAVLIYYLYSWKNFKDKRGHRMSSKTIGDGKMGLPKHPGSP